LFLFNFFPFLKKQPKKKERKREDRTTRIYVASCGKKTFGKRRKKKKRFSLGTSKETIVWKTRRG